MSFSPITAALQPFVDRRQLAGAVTAVASANALLDVQTVGFADIEAELAMTADAMFWIASTTKPMTAAAFMMLVDQGKVHPADAIETYLPEYAGMWYAAETRADQILLKKAPSPITIQQALTHTSGLPFLSRAEKVIDARPLREACVSYAMGHLAFEPGTQYMYANGGTNTVGRIIEVVSGMAYEEFLQTRLLDPLGMTQTTFFPNQNQLSRLARSYQSNTARDGLEVTTLGQYLDPFASAPRYACPGGGLFSTAADVVKFGQMILRGGEVGGRRYLSREAVRTMSGTQTGALHENDGPGAGYGYCLSTLRPAMPDGPSPAGPCGHGGAYANHFWIDPDVGLIYVFMIQHAGWPEMNGASPFNSFRDAASKAFGKLA